MVSKPLDISLLPLHFVLMVGALIGLIVVVNAYCPVPGTCSSNPSVFGHSSDEIEYTFVVNQSDCTNQLMPCLAQCASNEQAISGSCVTNRGWGTLTSGLVDTDFDLKADAWICEEIKMDGCNFNGVCEHWSGESILNCSGDCPQDSILFARVVCVPEK